ncbi:DUF6843 domain-containing protein [Flagellimonas abyssi]|uniref:DUF6843 domain-containing protein n=1 Tax=Flagellimonas abyssi TaxID=2864871 RepID=A0ABS7ESF5_9FLAO|nr:hypothetical protein [Allomuricauda abyssi]MBW8200532.1 hypothetical protein [Allomuricauda abyssi]
MIRITILILLITMVGCAQKAEDTIRLIPEGYEGAVVIIYNQEDGAPKEYEENARVYRIPETGVLRTQFEPNYGVQNHQFFYVGSNGERSKIQFVMTNIEGFASENKGNDKIFAYLEQTIGEVEKYNPDTKELIYIIEPARTFYIGRMKDIDKDYQEQLNFTFKHHKNQ